MPKGFVYILECTDGSLYTGSTIDLDKRLDEHQNGNGSNYTKKRLPVKLVYFEEFQRIDNAFFREKQIQGWNRKKKEALIKNTFEKLPNLSLAYRDKVSSRASDTTRNTIKNSNDLVPEALQGTISKKVSNTHLKTFKSNGKLLLTAEYVVLDGALALAIPTKYGQSLTIEPINEPMLIWESLDEMGNVWFKDIFKFFGNEVSLAVRNHNKVSNRLLQILNTAKTLNPGFLNNNKGFKITTKLDFPRQWGLGTSSTLINNIAQWAKVDAYQLLEQTFGGSGYDIACAQHDAPITYQLFNTSNGISRNARNDKSRNIKVVEFHPPFKEYLYFVYLNQKQNSRDGIAQYKKNASNLSEYISEINKITQNIISCSTLDAFILLIEKHENTISKIIKQKPVKDVLFSGFNGAVKSLGAWGGDFVLVASKDNPKTYFKNKGFETVIPFKDMVLYG